MQEIAPCVENRIQTFGAFVNQDGAGGFVESITQSPLIEPYDADGKIKPYPFNTLDTNPFLWDQILMITSVIIIFSVIYHLK